MEMGSEEESKIVQQRHRKFYLALLHFQTIFMIWIFECPEIVLSSGVFDIHEQAC